MDNKEFSQIRYDLGKTQAELARLLCVSYKAVQSFEQGWRKVPASIERELLFMLAAKRSIGENIKMCWAIKKCPKEWRDNCTAWEYKIGKYCWFINGTFCQGQYHETWREKIQICRQCEVFSLQFPTV
ncbi:MAG: hypothetical protein JSU58_03635 [Dehalococcoidales bacterium]|nr:MAG: hypothetical protein JSU58_03635 [Dehalococcoidales bacterium]